MTIQRVRRARRKAKHPQRGGSFPQYKASYRKILRDVKRAGGEDALAEISEWMVEWVEENRQLPEPETVREHAKKMLDERGVEIPNRLQPL